MACDALFLTKQLKKISQYFSLIQLLLLNVDLSIVNEFRAGMN